ncbi:MAG: hypothetical protein GY903_27120 [Fuerstiella sp.]|nr:hypothetical protein [Fuerstiella sp.]MCP4858170.1 hypothetical protein [Fuerstiella sp.]
MALIRIPFEAKPALDQCSLWQEREATGHSPAPSTSWNASGTELTIQWSDQEDIVILDENNAGRTIPVVKRDGKTIGGCEELL